MLFPVIDFNVFNAFPQKILLLYFSNNYVLLETDKSEQTSTFHFPVRWEKQVSLVIFNAMNAFVVPKMHLL